MHVIVVGCAQPPPPPAKLPIHPPHPPADPRPPATTAPHPPLQVLTDSWGGVASGPVVVAPPGVRQLLGTADAQTTPAATSTAPVHQRRGSANAETTPAAAPAAVADRTQ